MGDEVFYEKEWNSRWSVWLVSRHIHYKTTQQLQHNHGTHGIHQIS